jgi:hypothetical protein
MNEVERFAAYSHLADKLIDGATKEQLADVARILALNCGYYMTKYGDVPQDVLLRMIKAERVDGETAPVLVSGVQSLVAALAEVTGLDDDLEEAERH